MPRQERDSPASERDDRILPLTRVVAAVVMAILILAFVILYLNPTRTSELWAWEIRPNSTAIFMGSGYFAGAYLFMRTAIGTYWHRTSAAFLPITAFTVAMLLATLLHLNRFDLSTFAARTWLLLYILTPLLVPYLWYRNRTTDSGAFEALDAVVPEPVRLAAKLIGGALIALAVAGFVYPPLLIDIWAWKLTPLTARVASGWMIVFGGSFFMASLDTRWSAWRVVLEAAAVADVLMLIGALMNKGDFTPRALAIWAAVLVAAIALMAAFHIVMTLRQRSREPMKAPGSAPS
jgi:hypothetical protein